ncbi:MAG: NAD(P)/FAD-dependent oxidoreductase [Nitrospirota bacterium]|nr:NAD(P)/FAD-dependent oxidoreductase [Nitrospirota bacterium]MDE3241614.1 NAD(P)/FAD-dependent oxidoreductase [Nitrospirota bacterium]
MPSFDVIVVGAGGAGLMCALQAARRGRLVLALDHAPKIGKKILISGGGRCNFTNLHATPANFVSRNPHFCKSALARFTPEDFIQMVKARDIPFHEKKLGQLFCDRSARDIVAMLVQDCAQAGVTFQLNGSVKVVTKPDRFCLDTSQGSFSSESLVIATGGPSVPDTGATDFGYGIARQFGLAIVEPEPALVGLTWNETDRRAFGDLTGLSADTIVTSRGHSFRENILFTHGGLSGPAILQASLYWHQGDPITIDLLPDLDPATWLLEAKRQGEKAELKTLLASRLPKRLAEKLCALYLSSKPVGQLADKDLEAFAQRLHRWTVMPSGTEGFKKAEVTRGGVDTNELSSQTMEAKKVPGLYFIGEVVDVTGQLGGYNFQWAWASGWAAGQAV